MFNTDIQDHNSFNITENHKNHYQSDGAVIPLAGFSVYHLLLPDVLPMSSSLQHQTHFQEISANEKLVTSRQAALWGDVQADLLFFSSNQCQCLKPEVNGCLDEHLRSCSYVRLSMKTHTRKKHVNTIKLQKKPHQEADEKKSPTHHPSPAPSSHPPAPQRDSRRRVRQQSSIDVEHV